jgi:hypothetical protein
MGYDLESLCQKDESEITRSEVANEFVKAKPDVPQFKFM